MTTGATNRCIIQRRHRVRHDTEDEPRHHIATCRKLRFCAAFCQSECGTARRDWRRPSMARIRQSGTMQVAGYRGTVRPFRAESRIRPLVVVEIQHGLARRTQQSSPDSVVDGAKSHTVINERCRAWHPLYSQWLTAAVAGPVELGRIGSHAVGRMLKV